MTLLATVFPWRAGELALVYILVAIDALRKLDLELRFLSCRNVAGGALDLSMWKYQGEAGLGVIRDGECRRAPTLHGVTALAAAAISMP